MKRLLVAIIGLLSACLGDPVGPRGALSLHVVDLDTATTIIGAPGRPLPAPLSFEVRDEAGRPIAGARVLWSISGTGAYASSQSQVTDQAGRFTAIWVLGTNAQEPQQLTADVSTGAHTATVTIKARAVPVEIADLRILSETTLVRLGAPGPLVVLATDPFGNLFLPADLRVTMSDTLVAGVDSVLTLIGRRRGIVRVSVDAGSWADTAWIHVTQVVREIRVDVDTVRFHSLGQLRSVTAALWDDLGNLVADSNPVAAVIGSPVAAVQTGGPFELRSLANGSAELVFRVGSITRAVTLSVWQRPAQLRLQTNHHDFDALRDTLLLQTEILDSLSVPVSGNVASYASTDNAVATVAADGQVVSVGNGTALIVASLGGVLADTSVVVVNQVVDAVETSQDSVLFESLNAEQLVSTVALDRLGAPVTGVTPQYAVANPSIASVDAGGLVRALTNGLTTLRATVNGVEDTVTVAVVQRPFRVVSVADTIRFVALGDTALLAATAEDSLGSPVSDSLVNLSIGDSSIAQRLDATRIRSGANGVTAASFTVAGLPANVTVVVQQVTDSIDAAVTFNQPIVTLPVGAILPLYCSLFDRNGFPIPDVPAVAPSSAQTVVAGPCGQQAVLGSGFDTLRVSSGPVVTLVPVVIAAAPIASSAIGSYILVDSFPTGTINGWAPTLHRTSSGVVELYTAAFTSLPDSSGATRSDLHRFVFDGGTSFHYDGIAIPHDNDICSPQGQGIENMTIVPRNDAPGWRMYYAAGSNFCYGWQVFSAVSVDERTWIKEPGIRLDNGGGVSFASAIWPAGEGMVVDQLPSGEWRMIVSTYERVTPAENKWQITEWRSPDQLNWSYIGPVLTTRDMPPEAEASVYSPTIREVRPGLWRMVFTGDNRTTPGGRSKIWSAVSLDKVTWQVEGELMGAVGSDLYYSSLVDETLVFVRRDGAGALRLAMATVQMP